MPEPGGVGDSGNATGVGGGGGMDDSNFGGSNYGGHTVSDREGDGRAPVYSREVAGSKLAPIIVKNVLGIIGNVALPGIGGLAGRYAGSKVSTEAGTTHRDDGSPSRDGSDNTMFLTTGIDRPSQFQRAVLPDENLNSNQAASKKAMIGVGVIAGAGLFLGSLIFKG